MSVTLFKKTLTNAFVASNPIEISGTDLTLFFDLVLSGGPSTVQFYLEYTDTDPTSSSALWRREVDEVDDGTTGGVTHFRVVRSFESLADGTYNFGLQFARRAPYARVQIKASAGGGSATIIAPYGTVPQSP